MSGPLFIKMGNFMFKMQHEAQIVTISVKKNDDPSDYVNIDANNIANYFIGASIMSPETGPETLGFLQTTLLHKLLDTAFKQYDPSRSASLACVFIKLFDDLNDCDLSANSETQQSQMQEILQIIKPSITQAQKVAACAEKDCVILSKNGLLFYYDYHSKEGARRLTRLDSERSMGKRLISLISEPGLQEIPASSSHYLVQGDNYQSALIYLKELSRDYEEKERVMRAEAVRESSQTLMYAKKLIDDIEPKSLLLPDYQGITPMQLAMSYQQIDIVGKLIEKFDAYDQVMDSSKKEVLMINSHAIDLFKDPSSLESLVTSTQSKISGMKFEIEKKKLQYTSLSSEITRLEVNEENAVTKERLTNEREVVAQLLFELTTILGRTERHLEILEKNMQESHQKKANKKQAAQPNTLLADYEDVQALVTQKLQPLSAQNDAIKQFITDFEARVYRYTAHCYQVDGHFDDIGFSKECLTSIEKLEQGIKIKDSAGTSTPSGFFSVFAKKGNVVELLSVLKAQLEQIVVDKQKPEIAPQ